MQEKIIKQISETYNVPEGYWQAACEDMDYPLACVCPNNTFMWVNSAFEKLLGYSVAELYGKTWMSITEQKYVGGDLASVHAVVSGKITHYTMSKNYIHKRGFVVPVELTVRRFPMSAIEDLVCFIAEAPPTKATKPELDQVEQNLLTIIEELKLRVDHNERGINISMGNRDSGNTSTNTNNSNSSTNAGGDNVGRNKNSNSSSNNNSNSNSNSDTAIKIMGTGFCIMAVAITWIFYYISVANKPEMPQAPPKVNVSSPL